MYQGQAGNLFCSSRADGPKRTYIDEGNGWFKVSISGSTPVRIKVDSNKDNDENFIITGVKIPSYGISVKP